MVKDATEFVYTLSSRNRMVIDLIKSIKTLVRYTQPKKIHVFYSPPFDEKDQKEIENLGVNLHKVENTTSKFRMGKLSDERHFGEKINLCKIDAKNVVFLDCDTLILSDPWNSIRGNFEFKARPDSAGITKGWENLFRKENKNYVDWMPNAGFMIFKNNSHKKISKEWKDFLKKEYDYRCNGQYHKEQIALALAVSELKLEKMNRKEHVFEWENEKVSEGIVHHLDLGSTDMYPIDHTILLINRRLPFDLTNINTINKLRDLIVARK